MTSENNTVAYVARLQSLNCRSIFGHNIRHLCITYNLSWYDLEKESISSIKKSLGDKYFNTVQDIYFNYAYFIRDISQRNESFNEFFLEEEDAMYFLRFLCTS